MDTDRIMPTRKWEIEYKLIERGQLDSGTLCEPQALPQQRAASVLPLMLPQIAL